MAWFSDFITSFMFILAATHSLICLAHYPFYRLEREGERITKNCTQPLINETVYSRTECFLKCFNHIPCCYAQIKRLPNNNWLCSLFLTATEFYKTEEDSNSDIFSVADDFRCSRVNFECTDLYQTGIKTNDVYDIRVKGEMTKVFCDMTNEGGGWTVIQRRMDGSVDFKRSWDDYKKGFGNITGEYWLGNDIIHQMTKNTSQSHLVRIKATTFQGVTKYIIFKGFRIEGEDQKYKLHTGVSLVDDDKIGGDWHNHDQMSFTTMDNDNDLFKEGNCARQFSGGWWYGKCLFMNPNNIYSQVEDIPHFRGITWPTFNTHAKSMKEISMAIKVE